VKAVIRDRIPVIRRFSGGGTVIVDEGTVFVTLICQGDAVPVPKLYPRPIMDWTEHLYIPAFETVAGFKLLEHGETLPAVEGFHSRCFPF
jgi:lipoate-protein ligase A